MALWRSCGSAGGRLGLGSLLRGPSLLSPARVLTAERREAGEERRGWLRRRLGPYAELVRADKPIGTWLLFLPCTWSLAAASAPGLPPADLLCLFWAGAWLMRGAGCVINDLWDRDIDRLVERTRTRPLASGAVSQTGALVVLSGLLSVSLAVLLQLNWLSVAVGLSSMGLVATYPLAKRFTHWPQAVLGLTFNWGALVGWTAVTGAVAAGPMLSFYSAGLFWTLVYDTIYAHQDKRDDVAAGVGSSALRLGDRWTKPALGVFSAAMLGSLASAGVQAELGELFFLTLPFVGLQLARIVVPLDLGSPEACAKAFRANRSVGLLVLVAVLLGSLSQQPLSHTSLRLL